MGPFKQLGEKIGTSFANLNDRERKLLLIMGVVLALMGAFLATHLLRGRLETLESEVATKRAALDALNLQGAAYLENVAFNQALQDQLANNTLRLSTFIEGRVSRASIPRAREFRDAQQTLDGITMLTTTASFSAIEFDQMQRFLSSIEEADELVFIRRLKLDPSRNNTRALDLSLTLATWQQGGEP